MSKKLYITVLLAFLGLAARAQVFIINDNVFQQRMSEIKTTVLDSLTTVFQGKECGHWYNPSAGG